MTARPDIWTPQLVAELQALHDPRAEGMPEPEDDERPLPPARRHAIASALADLIIADVRRAGGVA